MLQQDGESADSAERDRNPEAEGDGRSVEARELEPKANNAGDGLRDPEAG